MNAEDFLHLIEFETDEINHFFKKASLEGKGTSQEVSDRREIAVKRFLEKFFPFPYRVAKGNIIDSYGQRSNSIDCLILNPCHPHTVSDENKYSIIFADGVDVAIEVKPDLSNKNEIFRSLEQIKSVKNLRRQKYGLFGVYPKKFTEEQILTAKQIPSIIFSNKTFSKIETLLDKVGNYYIDNNIKSREQFDMIVINDKGILFNSRKDLNINFSEQHQGFYFVEFGKQTLATFLFYLNKFPQCEMRIDNPVLDYYLKLEPHMDAILNEEINKKLIQLG